MISDKFVIHMEQMSKYGGKTWVRVEFPHEDWIPSFYDLLRIIQAVAKCEEEKYPYGEGKKMVADICYEAASKLNATPESLVNKYKVPNRNSDTRKLL
jgi:hypothetical protein